MPTNVMAMLQSLSRAQIERLLKVKERIETLQGRRDELRKELAQIDVDLNGLLEGTGEVAKAVRGARKSAKGAAAKSAAAKKAPRKKTSKKRVAKAKSGTAAKIVKAGKPARTAAKPAKDGRRKSAAAPQKPSGGTGKRATLEDVVYSLIEKHGEPVAFQVLLATITGKKLFKTRSSNFDNVLRRTLSTSKRIKRVGRGLYGI
jgi:hypothetical protein